MCGVVPDCARIGVVVRRVLCGWGRIGYGVVRACDWVRRLVGRTAVVMADVLYCPECGGPGVLLGRLGERVWWRCRACGIDFSRGRGPRFSARRGRLEDPKDPERGGKWPERLSQTGARCVVGRSRCTRSAIP